MRALPIAVLSILFGSVLGAVSAYWSIGPQKSASDIAAIRGDINEVEASYPKISVDALHHDFGSMQRGTTRSHAYRVTNNGDAPLKLNVASTTCKCTGCDVGDGIVDPGETIDVTLEWIAKSNPGTFRQTATLDTNDPRARRIELTVEGQVTTVTGLQPEEFFFAGLHAGDEQVESVYLMGYEDENLTIESAKLADARTDEWFEVSYTKVDNDELPADNAKVGYRIDVKTIGNLPLGPLHHWVTVKTNQKENSEFQIPIQGTVRGDIEVTGPGLWNDVTSAVHFGDVQSEEGAEVKLFLTVTGGHAKETTFEVAEVDPETLEIEIGDPLILRDELVKVPLTVRIPKGLPPVIRNGSDLGEAGHVVLKTNHPINPEISFGVRFVIKRQSITK
ncbi:DUF1573 domain-containing protein [Aeoliella mucimassa]|uniref:DUF1573 domain-containing protein n=1 Tax=Aeoliella mucimassa TaxID=2527972 RepID=A0A518AIX7_9BACT|nr:DUF1573 domain-containing protein [Aeoliella mucimassa]QDU54624.1 hypothetical protein Pan181_08070 [Aeoliella mucimassa]